MSNPITLTERELDEIKLCMYYTEHLKHGTSGHNRMVLLASLAHSLGFAFADDDLLVPDIVTVAEIPNTPRPAT